MFKSLFLFFIIAVSLNAQTTYYFSTGGNDSNSGTSQSSPKQSLSELQDLLSAAQPGDKFLLKRGDTWTERAGVYGLDISSKGAEGNPVVIGNYGSGPLPEFNFGGSDYMIRFHSGSETVRAQYVIIDGIKFTSTAQPKSNRPDRAIHINGSSSPSTSPNHITIKNCEIDNVKEGLRVIYEASFITVENCDIRNTFGDETNNSAMGQGVYSSAANTIIRNNTFYNCGSEGSGRDHPIYISRMQGPCLVEGNDISNSHNGIAVSNAKDLTIRGNKLYDFDYLGIMAGPQSFNESSGFFENILIEKNIIYDAHSGIDIAKSGGSQDGVSTGKNIKVINNLIYNNDVKGIAVQNRVPGQDNFEIENLIIANNTILNCGVSLLFKSSGVVYSNVITKNNILYNSQFSSGTLLEINNSSHLPQLDLNNNLYYSTVGNHTKVGSTVRTLNEFQSAYPDKEQDGISADPLLTNFLNFIFNLNENSPAINSGSDLSNYGVNTDFDGNPRPFGNRFDIGAFEYIVSSGGSGLKVNTRVFLQGPFDTDNMVTGLAGGGYIPLTQPYNTAPWNYNGNESLSDIPQDVVDWVLVELRSSTSASSVVGRKAALLRNDGIVIDPEGEDLLTFTELEPGNYFLVIKHRNHLDIMSSDAVYLDSGSDLYDFTTGSNKAYGVNALVELGNGKWGMPAGDGDLNGLIDDIDYETVGNYMFETGYKYGDLDLNGIINIMDYGKTNLNLSRSSQVPE